MTQLVEKYLKDNFKTFEGICKKMFSWKEGTKIDPRSEQALAFLSNYFQMYVKTFGQCPKINIHYRDIEAMYISIASNIESGHDYYGRIRYHVGHPKYTGWYWSSNNDLPCSLIKGGAFKSNNRFVIKTNL